MNMPTVGNVENANKPSFPQKFDVKRTSPPCDVLSHLLTGEHLCRQSSIAGELVLAVEFLLELSDPRREKEAT